MERLSTPFGRCGGNTGPEQVTGQVQECGVMVPRSRAPKPFTIPLATGHEKGTFSQARQGRGLSLSHCFARCWSEGKPGRGHDPCHPLVGCFLFTKFSWKILMPEKTASAPLASGSCHTLPTLGRPLTLAPDQSYQVTGFAFQPSFPHLWPRR